MKLIVPCGGKSSRFPNMPPKWILPDHEGIPMIVRAVQELQFNPSNLVVTILKEHEAKFNVRRGLVDIFGEDVTTVVLERPTLSQSETVVKTLKTLDIREPFLVKDSDNSFRISKIESDISYVTVSSLNDFDLINPKNKSYVTIDQEETITCIREKRVISDLFSVGGYFFRDAEMFLSAFEKLNDSPGISTSEIYISEIISYMLLNGEHFKIRRAENYQDWGTIHEWRRKLEGRKLFFVSVDGFLFERGYAHFSPGFHEVKPNKSAIDSVRNLVESGHEVVYLSIRPDNLKEMTTAVLQNAGLPVAQLLMGCNLSQWTLVTAPHSSMPYMTSRAREVSPDDLSLIEKLTGLE